MNYRKMSIGACRLIALFFFIKNLSFLPGITANIFMISQQQNSLNNVLTLLSVLVPILFILVLSILLWIFADRIAVIMIKETPEETIEHNIDYDKLQYIAFSLAGIIIIIAALPLLATAVYRFNFFLSNQYILKGSEEYINELCRIIVQVFEIIAGLWLTLGSRGIIKGINSLRNAGTKDANAQE